MSKKVIFSGFSRYLLINIIMKPLFTIEMLEKAKSRDKLPCECIVCKNTFFVTKNVIKQSFKPNSKFKSNYCSRKCQDNNRRKENTFIKLNCCVCNKEIIKQQSAIKRHKNHFCSHSCSTTHFNKHKTNGNRRSKLEQWLEVQLTMIYPNLEIHYNRKDTINSELDIYIPSLNLAFELNGIFHYEPIYGINKLNRTRENDISKSKACHEAKINLCIIDTSSQKYFKPSTSQKYLDIIITIINNTLCQRTT